MKHSVTAVILAISLSASTGCTTMTDMRSSMAESMRMFRPRPFDETPDPEEAVEDAWGKMMSEARPQVAHEEGHGSSWLDKLGSPQTRSIESSLGL